MGNAIGCALGVFLLLNCGLMPQVRWASLILGRLNRSISSPGGAREPPEDAEPMLPALCTLSMTYQDGP